MNTYTYGQIEVGHKESFKVTVTEADMDKFRNITGDVNPLHRDTEYAKEQVYAVIDERYKANLPLIITTNLTDFKTEDDVRRRRVYDRIFEVCTPIKMDGESKRRAEGQKKRDSIRALLEA